MSSPEIEKNKNAIKKFMSFCENHNKTDLKVKSLIKELYGLNSKELKKIAKAINHLRAKHYSDNLRKDKECKS